MTNKNDKAEQRSITVTVKFQGQQKGQELPPARAYLFDRTGRLLGVCPSIQPWTADLD